MIPPFALRNLDSVAAHLPFHLDDIARVNDAFRKWCGGVSEADRRNVDLWTYCYVRRYFLIKFIRNPAHRASDLDALVEATYQKIEKGRGRLGCEDPYASWVSVICKNTFLNYVTRRRKHLSVDDTDHPVRLVHHESFDQGMILVAVLEAIDRLPPSLQEVATLRFVEDMSYPEMAEATGKDLPILRAYVNKARKRLQADRTLRGFLGER